ncbi:MAG: hypothetical protein IH862_07915 [Chloroflexi bacterium]|nr:hypothetical protein [Chloroflexota bacterium]
MGRFSNQVRAIVTDFTVAIYNSFAKLDNFLDACGVPEEYQPKSPMRSSWGKTSYLGHVLDSLNADAPDILQRLITRLARNFRDPDFHESLSDLRDALRQDGFEIDGDGTVIASEILQEEAQQTKDRLRELLGKSGEDVSVAILNHHLEEHDRLYSEGHYGSSAGEARKFVEQIFQDIAKAISAQAKETKSLNRPVEVRDYLESKRFFDKDERKRLIDGVYGYLSNTGSHPGVTDVTVGRMARVIFLNCALYVLEKWQSWKNGTWTP